MRVFLKIWATPAVRDRSGRMLSPQAQVQHRLKPVFAVFSLPRARPQPRANKRASMGRGTAYRSPRTSRL